MLKMLSGLMARMIGRKPQQPKLPDGMMRLRGMDQWRCSGFTMVTDIMAPPTITVILVADNATTNSAEWAVDKDCAWIRTIAEIGGNHLRTSRRLESQTVADPTSTDAVWFGF